MFSLLIGRGVIRRHSKFTVGYQVMDFGARRSLQILFSRKTLGFSLPSAIVAVCALLTVLLSPGSYAETTTAASYAGGDGTSGTPYQISTLAELRRLSETTADWAASTYFELTSDIDASDTSTWNDGLGLLTIGNGTDPFLGSFDGNGHVIAGLTINRPSESDVGLFGRAGSGSSIQNVGLEGGSVSGYEYVGGLVGYSIGTVTSSYATGSVTGVSDVGGLVGWNNGTVTSSYATGSVSGSGNVGGLVGQNFDTVTSSYATGSV